MRTSREYKRSSHDDASTFSNRPNKVESVTESPLS